MKRIAEFAVAATILAALGIFVSWIAIGGGSTNIAFARVAKALDSLRTATYDCTMEMKNPMDGKTITIKIERLVPCTVARTYRNVDVHGFRQGQGQQHYDFGFSGHERPYAGARAETGRRRSTSRR